MSVNAPGASTEEIPSGSGNNPDSWRMDAVWVALATVIIWRVSVRIQVSEHLFAFTRHWERLDLDEVPMALFALSTALLWFAWRRYRYARRTVRIQRQTEARLGELLADNRRLAQEHVRIEESERKRLARELHDELGQYLNAIKLDAAMLAEVASEAPVRAAAGTIMSAVDRLQRVVGDMIARLRPVGFDELGLLGAIEHCIDQWRARTPRTRFTLTAGSELEAVEESVALSAYRVVQEALLNAHRHADATAVEVELRCEQAASGRQVLRVSVADNGRGMSGAPPLNRFGIRGMRERVDLAGGEFRLDATPGAGVRIDAVFPRGGVA